MKSPLRRPRLAVLLGVCFATAAAFAAQAEPAPPYSLLLEQSQARAPRLAEAIAAVRQAQGLARQARALPNPTASVNIENFQGKGPYSGFNAAETTVQLSQPIELGGKRTARVRAGDAAVRAAQRREIQARADYAADLAIAYAAAEGAQRRVTLARDALRLAEDDVRTARILVEAGRESQLRFLQVQSVVTAAQAEVEAALAAQAEAFGRLSALSAAEAPITSLAQSLLTATPSAATGDADEVATPAVIAAEAEREAAARRVNVERVRAVPDLTASVGVRRFADEDTSALVAGVSAPLPLFDRNRGNIDAARADLSAAEARLQAARLDARADLRTAIFQTTAADARVAAGAEAEKAASEAYRLTRTGYESGKTPLLELLTARRALVEAQSALVEAQLSRVRAEADLARLQGRAPFEE